MELRQLGKTYRDGISAQQVLHDVDRRVQRGECLVLLGRSGSGKSTLLNLVSGIDTPSSGDVLFDGASLPAMSESGRTLLRRRRMGFVFQAFNLVPTLTVAENLLLPLELVGVHGKAALERMSAMLELLGLDDRAAAYPDRLSGGEQQRVAIARALVHEPDLILADEPTGNLDLETGREVLALLDRLVREARCTMIMVTHSREVIGMADHVMTISEHRLVDVTSNP